MLLAPCTHHLVSHLHASAQLLLLPEATFTMLGTLTICLCPHILQHMDHASIAMNVSLQSNIEQSAGPFCSQNIYCKILSLYTDITCFCFSLLN